MQWILNIPSRTCGAKRKSQQVLPTPDGNMPFESRAIELPGFSSLSVRKTSNRNRTNVTREDLPTLAAPRGASGVMALAFSTNLETHSGHRTGKYLHRVVCMLPITDREGG